MGQLGYGHWMRFQLGGRREWQTDNVVTHAPSYTPLLARECWYT